MATAAFDRTLPRPSLNPGPVGAALTLIALGAGYLSIAVTWRQGVLFLVGAGAGVVLYQAAFGFTSSWRAMIVEGRGSGLRAQMLMLAVTCAVFLPLLAHGQIFGQPIHGSVSPSEFRLSTENRGEKTYSSSVMRSRGRSGNRGRPASLFHDLHAGAGSNPRGARADHFL
jgi:hypothetical protein